MIPDVLVFDLSNVDAAKNSVTYNSRYNDAVLTVTDGVVYINAKALEAPIAELEALAAEQAKVRLARYRTRRSAIKAAEAKEKADLEAKYAAEAKNLADVKEQLDNTAKIPVVLGKDGPKKTWLAKLFYISSDGYEFERNWRYGKALASEDYLVKYSLNSGVYEYFDGRNKHYFKIVAGEFTKIDKQEANRLLCNLSELL